MTCTVPDCDRRHKARGLCATHYQHWWWHSRPRQAGAHARRRAALIEDLTDILGTDSPLSIARRVGYTRPASLARRLDRAGRHDLARIFWKVA